MRGTISYSSESEFARRNRPMSIFTDVSDLTRETFRASVGTGREMLANPDARAAVQRLLPATDDQPGRSYSAETDEWASRKITAEARQILVARAERRAALQISLAARIAAPGKFVSLARQRKIARVKSLVSEAYRSCGFRTARAGDHTLLIAITDADRPHASGDSSKGARYSTRCTFRKTDSEHRVRVDLDWERQIALIPDCDGTLDGGLLVLSVEQSSSGHLAVLVARQGRGFSLDCECRYVLPSGRIVKSLPKKRVRAEVRLHQE